MAAAASARVAGGARWRLRWQRAALPTVFEWRVACYSVLSVTVDTSLHALAL